MVESNKPHIHDQELHHVETLGEQYAVKSLHSCLQLGKVKINRYRLSDWNRRGSSHRVFSAEVRRK
jgi:hypothetical protein